VSLRDTMGIGPLPLVLPGKRERPVCRQLVQQNQIAHAASPPTPAKNARGSPTGNVHAKIVTRRATRPQNSSTSANSCLQKLPS